MPIAIINLQGVMRAIGWRWLIPDAALLDAEPTVGLPWTFGPFNRIVGR